MIPARRTTIVVSMLLTLAGTACVNRDDARVESGALTIPDLTGFDSVALTSASKQSAGAFRYLIVDGALDWYLLANGLAAGRAYRVVLTAPDGKEYAVGNRRSARDGSFAAHGVETMLMNKQCVGAEDPSRRPLSTTRTLRVALKNDGSASGASGNDMLGSRSALPCGGNGDGNFDYVLGSSESVAVKR